MRTLELNKQSVWLVPHIGEVNVIDEDGFYTGEVELSYGEPKNIRIPLYPVSGSIKENVFGRDIDIDMITVLTDIELQKNDLIFMSEPSGEYDKTYDFKVKYILKSLNACRYGLKGRL